MPGNKSGGCIWNDEYGKTYPEITSAKNGKKDHFHCKPCAKDLSLYHKGKADIDKHIITKDHIANCKKVAGTPTLDKLFSGIYLIFFFVSTHSFLLFYLRLIFLF